MSGRTARWIAAGLLSIALAGRAADEAGAGLRSAPFAVSVEVAPDGDGNSVTLTVAPPPGAALDASQPFDLYIALLQGFQEALFLGPSGAWSPRPTSVRRGLSMAGFTPVVVKWPERRFGSMHLLVIAARPSSDPLIQSSWLFRPVLRTVDVRARLADAPDRWQAFLVLGALGALSLLAVGAVLWLPRPR
jgi:hypothetical protein